MTTSIIDPSTLTEEQKIKLKIIIRQIKEKLNCHIIINGIVMFSDYAEVERNLLVDIFGSEFFKEKGE